MKSKILGLIIGVLLIANTSFAQTCANSLVTGAKQSSAQAAAFCSTLQSALTGDLAFSTSGKTIAIQEATAAAKCSGTITANGTTAVTVATTCATTGSRILLTRSSAPSGTAICWQTNIIAGTSFDLDCSAAETGTFDFLIVHEAP